MWHRLVTALALMLFISGSTTQAQTYNIWPLGNSITEGEGSTNYNGYRKPLYYDLKDYVNQQNEGVDINFVGTLSNGDFGDAEHDGWAGKKADFIRSNAQSWLNTLVAQNDTPDFVLFHIGTNDISSNRAASSIVNDIDVALDIIWNYGINIKVFLCGIIPRLDGKNSQTTDLNDDIWTLVDRRRNQEGKAIFYVDQYNQFVNHNNWETDYMVNNGTDYLHPNNTGYDAMANRFFGVVAQYLVPGTTPVELLTFGGIADNYVINLSWNTATESNNLGFYIEHSLGNDLFRDVGFVEGNGTTVESHNYTFAFEAELAGQHNFRLRQVDNDGTINYSREIAVMVLPPNSLALHQNYPNPFRPGFSLSEGTRIPFELQANSQVDVNIYNITGQLIKTVSADTYQPGRHEVLWDGRNETGMLAPSGTYLIRLRSNDQIISKTMQVVR
ncbi:T9SS type A sorting domain-containing protein [candidate division KSB1 bacterium]|nr:T9SS type A sorting domain-containing protein [candidate division KSB1 bacterium]